MLLQVRSKPMQSFNCDASVDLVELDDRMLGWVLANLMYPTQKMTSNRPGLLGQESADREGNLLLAPPWLLEGYGEPKAISGPHLCATATCMRGDTNRGPKVC